MPYHVNLVKTTSGGECRKGGPTHFSTVIAALDYIRGQASIVGGFERSRGAIVMPLEGDWNRAEIHKVKDF